MTDDETEEMVRKLLEQHLDEESRAAAKLWLDKRCTTYEAMKRLGLTDDA